MIKPIQQLELGLTGTYDHHLVVPEITVSFSPNSKKIETSSFTNSDEVADYIRSTYKNGEIGLQERFNVLFLNRKNKAIGYYRHSLGSHTATLVDEKIIVSAAVKSLASGVIISHNHPSANINPSQEDIRLTQKLKQQLSVFNIQFLDHVIISDKSHYSFADNGTLGGLKGIEERYDYFGIPELSEKEEKELGIGGKQLGKAEGRNKIYQMVNERILSMIRSSGELFWRKTWIDQDVDSGQQDNLHSFGRSFSTGKLYSGINFWAVNIDAIKDDNGEKQLVLRKSPEPFWLTIKQIKDQRGQLKKNAKSEIIVYFVRHFSLFGKGISSDLYWQIMKECAKNPDDRRCEGLHAYSALKYYRVFNQKDISGIDFEKKAPKIKLRKPLHQDQKVKACELMLKHTPSAPKIEHGGRGASYNSYHDLIKIPKVGQFENINEYYGTLFHELVHSTGHKSRLDRKLSNPKNSKDYAFEELIAELGASYLNAESGILFTNLKNSAAYLKSWNSRLIKEMEEDFTFFFKASAEAQKASNYILNLNDDGEPAFYKELKLPGEKTSNKTKALKLRAKAIKLKLKLQTI